MKPSLTTEDTLAHIDYDNPELDHNDPSLLVNQVSSTSGSITIISAFGCSLVLDYSVSLQEIIVTITLETPVGNKVLLNADLTASNPTVTIGGSIDSFKAEAIVTFDFSTMSLTASGEVCAPFVGCKKGQIVIHL